MPLPVINNVVRVAVRGTTQQGSPWVNVLHFRKTSGAIDDAALTALNTELNKLYGGPAYSGSTYWLLFNCNQYTLCYDATYTRLDGTSASVIKALTAAGSGTSNSMPPEVSVCVTLRTATRGRRYRGRLYLPPFVASAANPNGSVVGSSMTGIVAQFAGFRTALTGINWEQVIASYGKGSLNGQPVTWTPFATAVTDVSVDAYFDVQRRRKR